MSMGSDIKLACVIVTYDHLDMLKGLVQNIFDYTTGDYEIYVVENGQKPETIAWLMTQRIVLMLNERNMGTSASWNMGIREAIKDGCTHFAILSDDTSLPPGWWDACKVEFEGGSHLVSVDAGLPNIIFSGWFLVIDQEAVDAVGLFDEQFFFYFEDLDLSQRYEASGLKYSFAPIEVMHYDSATIRGLFEKNDPSFFASVYRDSKKKFKAKYPYLKFRM